ncbi:MAG: hypothetical protein WCD18_24570 [Thermosynechococcaceae cyanobacterium]
MAEPFFLDPDEAKTLGNLNYMRTPKKVKKSFPTTKAWGEGFEEEVEASATSKSSSLNGGSVRVEVEQAAETVQKEIAQRRQASSDLDIFRNMAKDMRKP